MSVAAEPLPAELPLPGGQPGCTVRLHPLLAADFLVPPGWSEQPESRLGMLKTLGVRVPRDRWLRAPVVSFALEHPGAGIVLVDTGLHPSVAVDPRANLGRLAARFAFRDLRMDASQAVSAQLRARGLDPSQVSTVVMTHLHIDHASGVADFPQATFVFSKAEWAAATASHATLHGYLSEQIDHAFDYRTLDFDTEDASSFASFGRSIDLFGDGSVRCVYTPGHTLGHVSVVVRTPGQEVLLAGDAIYTLAALREGQLQPRMEDAHLFKRSLHEIELYSQQTPDAVIIPGHDMEAWSELEPVYG